MSETDAGPSRSKGRNLPSSAGDQSMDAGQAGDVGTFGGLKESLSSGLDQDTTDVSDVLPSYSMNHARRGQALIFNNYAFKNMNSRPGTQRDETHLKTCLSKLGFEVKVKNDLSYKDIKERIAKAASEDHKNADAFICVFLSHGDDGVIFGKDSDIRKESTLVKLQEDVFDKFRGENCKSLIGKPKIFIIQACRGMDFEDGVIEADSVSPDANNVVPEVEEGSQPTIPSGADFIICYSTSQGFYSFRNSTTGSWYISSLCEQLGRFAPSEELTRILTRVHRQVSYRSSQSSNPATSGKKQMPCYISMLTKQLYLKPKLS